MAAAGGYVLLQEVQLEGKKRLPIAAFLRGTGAKKAALLAYNPLWHDKADKIGMHNDYRGDKVMTEWMEQKQIERCRKIFNDKGIAVV